MQHATSHLRLVTPARPFARPFAAEFAHRRPLADRTAGKQSLGEILMEMQAVTPGNMLKALVLRDRQDARLADILVMHGWVTEGDLMAAMARQSGARPVDLLAERPDSRLLDRIGAEFCLSNGILPWRRVGAATVVATARPEEFAGLRGALQAHFGPVLMALATERDIHASIVAARQTTLIRKAETRVVADQSCRSRQGARTTRVGLAALILLVIGAILAPVAVFGLLAFWAILSLVASTALKLACFVSEAGAQRRADRPAPVPGPARLPAVSMMVPLYAEDDIAPRLIRRIGRIDYPKELLDVLLVVEEDDHQTQAALAARDLPRWMRIVVVPAGPIRTKPRALNYALDFCRGSIVGIWDAEDAPEPAQIRKVVLGFHHCGPDVACLQGILDFDNSRHNWLTRCFTVEYAAWFRAVLPGLARLGFVVPLGGTTLFFRRETIEKLGGWDAHNVTEDADLGLRLARHGYRTELIDTVTDEEPNAHPLTWIRQRSRWQKGYAMTWASHMRDPARLWRELGAKRFWGVQILFLGSLSQSFLAPVLWTFWLLTFGLPHPLGAVLPSPVTAALIVLFVVSELINIAVGLWATRGPKHRHLMKWVPSLHFYFPLAALSSYKALYEWLLRPFYWDKTAHGVVAAQAEPVDLLPLLVLTNPAHVPAEEPRILSHPARHALAFRPARLHLAPVGPEEDAHRETAAVPSRSDRVALSLVTTAPRPPRRADRRPYVLGSAIAHAPRRSGIEFQPCFEGLGDM